MRVAPIRPMLGNTADGNARRGSDRAGEKEERERGWGEGLSRERGESA